MTFANSTAYNGKFVLQNALLQFADATDAERVLGGSTFVLDGGAVFELQNGAAGTLQNFVFDGGTLKTHQTTLSGAGTPQLIVTGDVSLDASSTIEAGGIVLSGGSDILCADTTGGVRQVFIQYSGNYSSADGQTLTIPDDALANSNIYNDGNTTDVVAKGKWSGSVGVDENGKQIYGDLQLIEINLIEEEVDRGLVLNASGAADTTLSALVTGSGNITFAGDMTIDGTADNTYTGTTTVSSGTVTLAKRNAFGETNYLNVSGDGHVNFNAQSTRIGRIQTSEAGALTGSGSITLFGQGRSNITGANTGLNAAISMLSGHTTVINDANGLGIGGITLNDGSTLILNYTNQGVAFDNTLTGGGTLQFGVNDSIYGSAALITGANAGFSGQIFITSNSLLNAEGVDVDDTLGTGLVRFGNEHSYLRIRSSGDSITLDNAFSGNGRIVVGGRDAGDQWFGFETTNGWTDGGFTGTLVLSKAGMRVGGAESANYGENNAANLRTASLELLDNRAKLEVSSGGTVRTFQDLLIDGGATVSFDGTAGFNAGNALADLAISGTLTLGSGNIALTLPGAEADMTGSLAHNQVIDTALRDAFETLIAAADGVSGNLSGITLNNGSTTGYSGTQNITGTRSDGSDGDVAYGRFNYGLATTDNALGLSFTLSEIDIIKGQTLVLAETGTLGATVDDDQTGTGSGGNLEIAALNTVTLNGKNTYTGKTTVRGNLIAGAQGLGRTSLLSVESGGSYANDGSNMVGGLSVNQDGVLILDSSDQVDEWTLTINQSGTESSTIAGAVQGAGDLILNAGQLTVNAHNDTNWRGNLALGTETASAALYLSGVNALGNGTVSFANSGSVINLAHNADLAFGNAVSGYGTITVDIDGHNFTFTNAEADLTAGSHLNLLNADFSLDAAQNADVAQKTLISLGSESTLFTNGGTEAVNRSIWGLDLTSGGTIHFGNIDASGGQLVLSSGIGENIVGSGTLNLSTNQAVTIVFNGEEGSTGSRVDDDNTGASLLSGGGTFDLDLFEGVTNLTVDGNKITSGGQINKALQTEGDFSRTSENYYQDADGDDASDDLVAVLRRGGSGIFFYDADRDAVYMKYGIREIDLQRSVADQGLMLNASGMTGAELSASVTGKGNIVFVKGEIAVSDQTNDYLGSTYVKDGASVTLSASSAFGKTDYLQIDTGGTVTLGSKVAQTVGELAGSGWLVLGAGSSFEIDNSQRKTGTDNDGNDPTAKDSFAINAIVTGAQGATFTIDGAGASTSGGRANVTFGATSNLTGTTLVYENMDVSFDSAGKGDHAYQTAASSSDLVLGTKSHLTVHANSGGSAQTYSLSNELSFDGGQIIFDDVTLTSGSTSAILHVGTLDLTQTGSIGVVATIDSGFNILDADTREFQQTLIQYGQLALGSSIDNLRPAFDEDMEDSRIYAADGRTVLAYVGWSGGIVDPAQAAQNTIAMSYQANALKLAQSGESDGLVLDATGHDSTLSILVTDADEVKNNGGGNITFAGGDIIVNHENGYTGVTKVTAGSVTIAQNSGFGRTSDLQVAGGAHVDLSGHEQTAGAIHTAGAHALRGNGTLTLGISGNDLNASFISGSNNAEGEASGFAGTVVLTNGHSLVLDNTAGLGDGTTADLQSGTLTVSGADGTFATTLTGAGTMAIEGGEVSIAGNNSSFSGAWRLSNTAHTTVSGSNALSADELLGTGDVNLADGTTMSLSDDPSKTGWSIDNAFVGAGRLEVLGTNSDQLQDFSFSKTWDPNAFTGSFEIGSGIRYTVASGSSNAVNMANGRAVLDEGAELQVATGGVVDTFDALNGSGGTIRFNGELGIDASTDELGKLQVGSLAGSGDIAVSVPGENDKVDQDLRETGVIDRDDNGFFQSLIIAENGTVTAEGWTLNGGTGGSGLHQDIMNAAGTGTVAQAIYRYGLEAGKDGDRNALGVGFDLETVDISGGKTLTLSEEGTLDAVVTNSSGSGNLTIAGKVVLSNADNDYTGSTTVTGTLTVAAGAIGDASARTAELIINAGTYINAGANTVGTLSASGGALELNDTLTIEDGGSNTISGGSISGAGALALNSGALMINGLQDSGYTGRVTVGTTAGGASISFESGTAGIGTGIVAFANNNSIVSFTGSDDLALTNTYSGAGTINVNLGGSGHVFAFNALQNLNSAKQFTGTLSLTNAQYQLYNDQTLAGAALRTNAGALVVVNADTLADRKVGSLTLGGGTIDFGQLSTTTPEDGQIRTDHLSFDAGDHTTINLSLGAFADADGSAVFGSGEKLYLFEGEFDRDNARNNLDQLTLDADATTQIVTQGVNDVARLHYNSGDLGVDADGIYAGWTLDTIELLTDANGGLNVTANGTISAIVSGSGDITFTGADAVVTIGGGEDNTYTGSTFVSSGAQVTLGRNEALGDTENLAITSGASVAFGGYTQTIGALNVDSDGSFSLAGGQITLGDNSVIRSANENVSGRIAVTNGHSLTLTNENAVGDAAVELGAADTLRLQGVGSGSAAGPAVFDNLIAAAAGTSGGIVSIEAGADVELQNTSNQFTQANIDATSTLHVNGMDATQTALGSAALNVSGTAVLAGNGTWTLSNGLAVDQAGALALSANGGEFNFGGMNQSVDGTVDLTNAVLRIGGNANATVLQNAELLGGTGANIHIATGSTAQTLDSLRLSGGHIWFDGVLGIGNAPTSQLGQLTVGSLGTDDDLAGTVHLTVSEDAASGGTIQSSELLTAADNGRYQSLITITGGQTIADIDLVNAKLDVSGSNDGIRSEIHDNNNDNDLVAYGVFGYGDTLVAGADGNSAGVEYTLQLVDIIGSETLEISQSGDFSVKITDTSGSGNLLVTATGEGLTLSNKTDEANDYTGTTTVRGTGSRLTAMAGALGDTSALIVESGAAYVNAGSNEVGALTIRENGSVAINAGTELTVENTAGQSTITGTLTDDGKLTLEAGTTEVTSASSGYHGNVQLGTAAAAGTISLGVGASLGDGTISFANKDSILNVAAGSAGTTLTNLLSGTGTITVAGNQPNSSFAFRSTQSADNLWGNLNLTNVGYDFRTEGNDVLSKVALNVSGGVLTLNGSTNVRDRSVNGFTVQNATIDFGTIGAGEGVLDMQNHALAINGADASTTIRLNRSFADLASETGSAAFMSGTAITLMRDASNDFSGELDNLRLELNGTGTDGSFVQKITQGGTDVAQLEGTAGDFAARQGEDDNLWDLDLNLTYETLRILNAYSVSETGEIALFITDNGAGAPGSLLVTGEGVDVTLSHANNDYHGATTVADGASLILAADRALGNTSDLIVNAGTDVQFGTTNQTVGEIYSAGALVSAEAGAGRLTTQRGGEVHGENSGFRMNWQVDSGDLSIDHVGALGTGAVALDSDAELVITGAGASGSFANDVSGAGGITVQSGANVALTGANAFSGGLTVNDAHVSAAGDVKSHIGTGTVALVDAGASADFTLENDASASWTWENAVTGSGAMTLARTGEGDAELRFKADSLDGFKGSLAIENWTVKLDGDAMEGTLSELASSQLTSLTIGAASQAEITGDAALAGKNVTVARDGTLAFKGIAGPGGSTSGGHLTAQTLTLKDGFNIDLGIDNASVASEGLLTQDDGEDTTVSVATALAGITGDPANGTVTLNGEAASDDRTIRFDVMQTGAVETESDVVAEGIYGYDIVASDSAGGQQDLEVVYDLEGVDIRGGKTLVLTGVDDAADNDANALSVYLTGEGDLRIAGNTVRLKHTEHGSDYKGETTVSTGAVLYAEAGALGDTDMLNVESRAQTRVEGNNRVYGLSVAANGDLVVGSSDSLSTGSDIVLTIESKIGEEQSREANVISGRLYGDGTVKVVGNGQVDGFAADLEIIGSQASYRGDLELENGAWVKISANDGNVFGNADALTDVTISKSSLLTITNSQSGAGSFYGIFQDGTDGGGTVEITLYGESDHFRFAAAQTNANFTGSFVLNQGTIDFNDLFTTSNVEGDALGDATLVLNENGTVRLGYGATPQTRRLGGLEMNRGTIAVGAIGYTVGVGSAMSNIDLHGGTMTLNAAEGDSRSTVEIGTTDTPALISDAGSEILNAGSRGVEVTLVDGIGSLVLQSGGTTAEVAESGDIASDYLFAHRPDGDNSQLINQTITSGGSAERQTVAEAERDFDEQFHFDKETGQLTIGYTIERIGLLWETADIGADGWTNDDLWQGLTITADAGERTEFGTNITNGSPDTNNPTHGNIVFKGAEGGTIVLTGDNTYEGKTWLTQNADIVFGGDHSFGSTEALRVDGGSRVDFAGYDQTMGALYAAEGSVLAGGSAAEASNLAVAGDATILGGNAGLYANWTFGGSVFVTDEDSLGSGTTALGANASLTVSGEEASGAMTSVVTGDATTSIVVESGANVDFLNTAGVGSFEGSLSVNGASAAGLAYTDNAALANRIMVGDEGTLRISSERGGELSFTNENTTIAGTLDVTNLTLDIAENRDSFHNAGIAAGSGAVLEVNDVIETGVIDEMTLRGGSTIAFMNGTPGQEAGSYVDLGASGRLAFEETVTVKLDINDYVNASEVSDVQEGLLNKRLTSQDLTTAGDAVLAELVKVGASGSVSGGLGDLNLDATGAQGNQLTIGIRNDASDAEDVAKGIYDYKLNTEGGLNLAYGLTEVDIVDGKTLMLAGASMDASDEDNILNAKVSSGGGLEITSGLIVLTDGDNDYTGETTVDAGAVLIAGDAGHTLGSTSKLELAAYQRQSEFDEGYGGRAAIYGAEEVGSLDVGENAVLYLVDNDAHNGSLTIRGTETSEINGTLSGAGSLTVEAESAGATLSVNTANTGFTGDVTIGNGAAVRIAEFNSLGVAETAGTIQIDQGGRLEVEAEVDATSSASRVTGTLANTVTGSGTVVVNVTTSGDSNDPARFSFADSQTGGPDVSSDTPVFDGTIRLEQGGFTLAFATDESLELTANQKAAWNAEISVGENGHLYVSQRDHENARFVDKHIRALTLDGGNIYFGGLRYDMQSLEDQLGGQLELAGDLNINAMSYVNLDAGTTNSLSDSGSELLFADTGAKIDLIQHAADILVSGGSVINNLGKLNEHLKLNISDEDAWQTILQKGEEVARVLRTFGQGEENNVFGIESSSGGSGYDLYLNYHVSEIELINPDQGLVITNNDLENAESLTAKLSGSGKITLAGGTILLGDGSEEGNVNTGEVIVTGTVVAGNYNAFGNGSTLTVNGGTADFGDYSQVLESLYSTGTLIGSSSGTITIKGEMEIEGSNNEFSSNIIFDTETATSGTSHDVDALGGGKITISDNYTLVVDDTEGGKLDNVIEGSGVLVVGTDESKPTSGSIELSGNNKGFTGDINVKDGWMLTAEMDADETAADHIGTGSLELDSGSNAGFTQTGGGLNWNSTVTGEGNLILTADANQSIRVSGGLENFSGSVTVSGGRFDLGDGNEAALHETDLVAAGGNTTITVLDTDDQVWVEGDFAVTDDADIVFNTPATPGTISDASLKVHGKLDLTGADITVHVDDSLTPGTPGTDSLTVQDILSEDRSSSLSLVIAEADGGIGNYTGDLTILNSKGETVDLGSKGIAINDAEGNRIATGYYSYGLNVTEDNPNQLGVSYQLTEVNVSGAAVLALEGATAGSPEYENALTLSANVTGEGGLQLTSGDLTLAGNANGYEGPTIVGTESGSAATLTVSSGSSLGRTDALFVYGNAVFVNESKDTEAGRLVVDENGTVQLDAGSVLTVTDSDSQSVLDGTLTGSGALNLNDGVSLTVSADKAQSYTGLVTVGDDATYDLQASSDAFVTVAHSFASDENTTARVGFFEGSFELEEANSNYHGSFVLSDGTVIRTDLIDAFGASDARIETAENASATVRLTYSGEDVGNVKQSMSSGITFEKAGTGVVAMSDSAMGAGAVSVTAGGLTFGTAGSDDSYSTDLTVSANAWAAGFGGVDSLGVESNGAFFVGGRNGYNSILDGEVSTVTFNVAGNLTNNGTIYVGNQTAEGETPLESGSIGNELVIDGDYVTSGGTLVMNAILAGDANSKADHVTITGDIKGTGIIDVQYNATASTGGTLKYLGLVSVGGKDPDSNNHLTLKPNTEGGFKVGDLWYALLYSAEKNEYYLESSETNPGTDPWDPNEREDVTGATIASLAFMQGQTFDLSLHDHIGETTYIDPITGEVRRTSFWMIQKGDWTRYSNDSGQVDTDGHTYTTHLGWDFYSNRMDTVTHRFGVLASFADGSYDMQSGVTGKATKASFRGYSAGLYWAMTPETESGPFAGLQLRWNKFDNELSGGASHDYDVSGISITAEAGWDQLMSRGVTDSGRTYEWRVEPHVRAYWTNFGDMDSWSSGQDSFKAENDNGLLVRVGARTKYTLYSGEKGKAPAVQTYAEANWAFNNAEYSVSTTNPYTTVESSQSGTNFAEFRLGVEAQFNKNVNVWLEGHHQTGSDDYESTGAMAGFKYLW